MSADIPVPPGWCYVPMKMEERFQDVVELLLERRLDMLIQYDRGVYYICFNAERSVLPLILQAAAERHPERWSDAFEPDQDQSDPNRN